MSNLQLSKSSSESDLKRYFTAVLELSHNDNMFPINLDEVWPLCYSAKEKAVRALKKLFYEGEDYITKKPDYQGLAQNGEAHDFSTTNYYLSCSCMEYFIARKVRPVFEVYRKVFHKTAEILTPSYQIEDPVKRAQRWIEEQQQLQVLQQQNAELSQQREQLEQDVEQLQDENITKQNIINLQMGEIDALAPKGRIYDQVIGNAEDSNTFTTRQVAQEIGMTDRKLYAILLQINVLYRQSDTYMLFADYLHWGLHKMVSHVIDEERGRVRTYLKWTNRGRAYIHALHDAQWDKRKAYSLMKKGTLVVTD